MKKLLRFLSRHAHVIWTLGGLIFVVLGTILVISYAKGYRPRLTKDGPIMAGTGLLSAESEPKGAQVLVNGKLTTATDDTLNLTPGDYEIEIKKDGYISWKKKLKIISELVTQTNTRLFPSVPNLTPLTFIGAQNVIPSPNGQKLVYKVSSAVVDNKNGLWVLELVNHNMPLPKANEARQIVQNISNYNFIDANLIWSPDSSQVLAYWITESNIPIYATQIIKGKKVKRQVSIQKQILVKQAILLDANKLNSVDSLLDATSRLPILLSQWHTELDLSDQEQIKKLPQFMQAVATDSARQVYFSPNSEKIIYTSNAELTIPDKLISDLVSESTQSEERDLKVNSIYVYDIKEDRNYKIADSNSNPSLPAVALAKEGSVSSASYWFQRLSGEKETNLIYTSRSEVLSPVPQELLVPVLDYLQNRYSPIFVQTIQWFPTSNHLINIQSDKITIIESDGQNETTVYAGPFSDSFAYPWPNGSRLIILANFNDPAAIPNLYALDLK